jgi:hypothetical protein
MESIIRNVRDIETDERQVLEHVLGQKLKENQQVIFHVVTLGKDTPDEKPELASGLPTWCNVYSGLDDQQIADVERVIRTRSDLTRRPE